MVWPAVMYIVDSGVDFDRHFGGILEMIAPPVGRKKKVCMIAYTKYSQDARVRREAETLACNPGFDVTVIALKEEKFPRTYRLVNVKVQEVHFRQYRGDSHFLYMLNYVYFAFTAFCHCSALFLSKGVDIVHVHNMPNFLVFGALLPKIFGKKVILDIHDTMPETFTSKFGKRSGFFHWALCREEIISAKFANKVICVNHPQRDVLVKRGIDREKIAIFMNVPDHRLFISKQRSSTKNFSENGFNMVYHGTITKRLGVDLTVHALAQLARQIQSLHFHIWGGGDHVDAVRRLVGELKLQNQVFFHGIVPVDVLPEKLAQMDLGIVSNTKNVATELMLPVKMMEYVALDIPIVAPRLRCIQHYFNDEMVTYFEPEDVESLQKAIARLYWDEDHRARQIEQARCFLEKYGWDKQSMDYINFYKGVDG